MVGHLLVDLEGSHQLGDVEPAQLEAMYAALRTERTGLRIALGFGSRALQQSPIAGGGRGTRSLHGISQRQAGLLRLDPQNLVMHYRGGMHSSGSMR